MSETVWIVLASIAAAAFFALPALLALWAAPRDRRERLSAMRRNLQARKAHTDVNVRGVQLPPHEQDEKDEKKSGHIARNSSSW